MKYRWLTVFLVMLAIASYVFMIFPDEVKQLLGLSPPKSPYLTEYAGVYNAAQANYTYDPEFISSETFVLKDNGRCKWTYATTRNGPDRAIQQKWFLVCKRRHY